MAGTGDPPSPYLLCIHGSPRAEGNTDILLQEVGAGAAADGLSTRHLYCRDLEISPCNGCGACSATGDCAISDEMAKVYLEVDGAAAVVIGSPVYFLGAPSVCKRVIDRFQPRWARRYVLGQSAGPTRPGALVATAGGPSHSVFSGTQRTVEALFDVIDVTCAANLLYEAIDGRGAIVDHPTALAEAHRQGQKIAAAVGFRAP